MRRDGEDILVLEPRLAGDDIGFGFFMWRYEVSPALRPVGLSFLPSMVHPTSPFGSRVCENVGRSCPEQFVLAHVKDFPDLLA